VDAVRQVREGIGSLPVQQFFELLQEHFRAGQFRPLFFFVKHRPVLCPDAAQGVEGPWMDHLSKHAGVQQAHLVDLGNPLGEPLNQPEQLLQLVFGEHIVDGDRLVRAADPVYAPVALDETDGVPGQVVVDDNPAILKVLALRQTSVKTERSTSSSGGSRSRSPEADRGEKRSSCLVGSHAPVSVPMMAANTGRRNDRDFLGG
jgi:hypothetical protein